MPTPQPQNNNSTLDERFDRYFSPQIGNETICNECKIDFEKLKSFIHSELSSQKERIINDLKEMRILLSEEVVIEMVDVENQKSYNQALDSAISKIKEIEV
jgi:hypothetical protein